MISQPSYKKISFVRYGFLIGMVCLCLFAGSRIVPILQGPKLVIASLPTESELHEPLLQLSGKITHAKNATIDGAEISMSPDGSFSKDIVLNTGYNALTFDIVDSLGNNTTKHYTYLLRENPTGTFAVSFFNNNN